MTHVTRRAVHDALRFHALFFAIAIPVALYEQGRSLGMAILLITHAMGVVAETCQRVVVMYAGRVVERAPVHALFDMPQHPYTIGLLGAIPRLDLEQTRLVSIEGQVPSPLQLLAGCSFAPRCPFAQPACEQQVPALHQVGEAHFSACLRAPLEAEQLLSNSVDEASQ